jgi:hypothetical protein
MNRENPSDVARHLFTLIDERRWSEIGALVDPEHLQEWYEHALTGLRSKPTPNLLTVDQYRQHEPDMPLEVAKWLTDRHNRSASEYRYSEFGPNPDAEQLAALSPALLFGRMLEERDVRTQIQRQVATNEPELAELAGETPVYRYNIIGEVRDDEANATHPSGNKMTCSSVPSGFGAMVCQGGSCVTSTPKRPRPANLPRVSMVSGPRDSAPCTRTARSESAISCIPGTGE